jgi:hypothetical protein
VWAPNARLPGLGTTITNAAGTSWLNLDDPLDIAAGSPYPIDPLFVSRAWGMTFSTWVMIENITGTVFSTDRMAIRILTDNQLQVSIADTASGRSGGCSDGFFDYYVSGNWYRKNYGGASARYAYVLEEWFHLMVVWNHWTHMLQLFINGDEAMTLNCGAGTILPWNSWVAGSNLAHTEGYQGQLANFYIWPRALYPSVTQPAVG